MTERASVSTLIWRDLLVAARTPALAVAAASQVVLLTLFMLVWGDGVPLVGARSVLAQLATTQWAFLALVLPWTAARCSAARWRDEVAELAALGAVRPASVIVAGVTALSAVLLAVTVSGLPFAILARRISAASMADWWQLEGPILALGFCVAPLTSACTLLLPNRLFAWTVATAMTMLVMAVTPPGAAGGLLLLALGLALDGLLGSRADGRCHYLVERA